MSKIVVAGGREDPVRGEAAVVAVDAVGLQAAGGFVGPVLPVFAILQPGPAAEEAVLFRMLIVEAIGDSAVTPVVRLGDAEIVVQRLEVSALREDCSEWGRTSSKSRWPD